MGDFIPFNQSQANRSKNTTPQSEKKKLQLNKLAFGSPAVGSNNLPAFGSPAVGFGSPAVNFGSPAVKSTDNSFASHQNSTPSPRHCNPPSSPGFHQNHMMPQQNKYNKPFNFSPRSHGNNYRQNTPQQYSPYGRPNNDFNQSMDGSGFRAPHSPNNRGRGFGRRSFSNTFGQTPRFGNCNPGGSSNIEDYYSPSMVEDPWCHLAPILAQT